MAQGAGRRSDHDSTESAPADEPAPSWRKAWPFAAALAVVGLIAAGIGLSYAFRPPDSRASESAQVQYAINNYYNARNNVDYTAYRDATCAADRASQQFPAEPEFSSSTTTSLKDNGRIVIPEITDLVLNGDRARATVHWQFDKKSDQKRTTDVVMLRENGQWKVCTA